MKLLVVDECCFTRVGIASYFADSGITTIKCCHSIEYATPLLASFQPSHILVNLSNQCRYNEADAQLLAFMEASQSALLFIYLDTPYPYSEAPMRIADNAFLFNKSILPLTLRTLRENPLALADDGEERSLFSPQELTVMKYWMAEMPNYRIAKKLQISSHTVYVHKRHITEKINARNRLEFYSLYNVLRYFYPPSAPTNSTPLALLAV
ncbi:helix-turn-helix transcriptional regulator [Serratia marcescens]|jgi:DNA-binding CsgD family transcriptional regulator|uniref:LuxR C-terminal-related transcriptional regulator n=1 Tax=Serratia TaxID=613 RepID=UPI0007C930F4|nr:MULTISPECIES: LuxR C-terminal-related transcriptional regulator [Serratia]MBH2564130.1 transcriptional regulator [Serratia marcescens]MDH2269250.1 LuxR C-terminal-related transcriptional regulator [Serratia marcescens]MDH2277227.1 LuxR C-terminal-related transcriptional regulator [Serratia marcescens]OAH28388.1 helix-turn-helix transcriptional regulator [Serratia marcescens]PTA78664.1 transcriptional regulator [Serratia sp. Nf2]